MAGCFSDRGLAIEVDVGDTGATSVELYVGEFDCTPGDNTAGISCTSIAPPDGTIALAGDVFLRNDPVPYTAPVKDGKATFVITSDTAKTLPVVIAVGSVSDSQGVRGLATLRELELPANSARIVTTTLVSAHPVQPQQSDSETMDLTEDRVMVWPEANPQRPCVVVEHWRSGEPVRREFLVPDEDPDCDGVPNECNAAAYLGTSAGGMASEPNCFAGQDGACVLGSLPCNDVSGPEPGTCTAQQDQDTVCVPSQFCGCTSLEPACMQIEMDAGVLPHITCTIPTTAEGNPCSNNNSIFMDLAKFYPSASCDPPRLGSLQLTALSTNTNNFSFGGAVMALESPGSPCQFSIVWKSGTHTPPLEALVVVEYGVVQLQTGDRITLVPITFGFNHNNLGTGTCDMQPFQCTPPDPPLDPLDPLWACAQAL
jgi:hypothetical protein